MAIKIDGMHQLSSPQSAVWDAILDPNILRDCIPGCNSLEEEEPSTAYRATVTAKIGPVKATFNGRVTLSEVNKPNSVRLSGAGEGGIAGTAKGSALITLRPGDEPGTTILEYDGNIAVGGKIAQLGSRLISSFVKKTSHEFFNNFVKRIET